MNALHTAAYGERPIPYGEITLRKLRNMFTAGANAANGCLLALNILRGFGSRAPTHDGKKWENAMHRGRAAYENGLYPIAIAKFCEALGYLRVGSGTSNAAVAVTMNNLGACCRAYGAYSQAEYWYQQAIYSAEGHSDEAMICAILVNLADLQRLQGRLSVARAGMKSALELAIKVHGAQHFVVAKCLHGLARIHHSQRRYAEAQPLYKLSFQMLKRELGPRHPEMAVVMCNLGDVYRVTGELQKAKNLIERALAIQEEALGASHPDILHTLNNLGCVYFSQGKHLKAELIFDRAMVLCEKLLEQSHPDVKICRSNRQQLSRSFSI